MSPKEAIAKISVFDGCIENLDENDARVILDTLDAAGYVVVPKNPTPEMIKAAMPHMDSYSSNMAWWDAMLKAAQ